MDVEQIDVIVKIAIGVGSTLCTAIPAVIGLIKAKKAEKTAKTEAQKIAAENDLLYQANVLIDSAEQVFKQVDTVLKRNGETAGPLKKDSVMSKLLAYAISKGYDFDENFWSTKVDEIVKLTRDVNSK